MNRLIIVRCAELTGFLSSNDDKIRQALTSKGKRRMRKAVVAIRPLLTRKRATLVVGPDIYAYKRAAQFLAHGLGYVHYLLTPRLGYLGCEDNPVDVCRYLSDIAGQYEVIVLVVGKELAHSLPSHLISLPGAFKIRMDRPLLRAEALHVDLVQRTFEVLNTPIPMQTQA